MPSEIQVPVAPQKALGPGLRRGDELSSIAGDHTSNWACSSGQACVRPAVIMNVSRTVVALRGVDGSARGWIKSAKNVAMTHVAGFDPENLCTKLDGGIFMQYLSVFL